jgi:hypothetical protein
MAAIKSQGPVRKFVTRVLATGAMLAMYSLGIVTVGGVILSASVNQASAGWRGRGRGRGRGDWVAPAIIGGAIVGGAIIANEARRRDDAIAYCMRRFRSYDPESMTYLGLDGLRHPCP